MKKEQKIKEAVALKYSPDSDKAPKIVALGKGEVAEKILEQAKENNVSIYEDESLAHNLNQLNIGDEIPPELYAVIAEVFAFVASLDKAYGEKYVRKK